MAGWRGWFVAGLLHVRLRVQHRLKSVDFHDAENQQRSCRMIIRHAKDSYQRRVMLDDWSRSRWPPLGQVTNSRTNTTDGPPFRGAD
ncbi:hypothetical protein TNCV_430651 [Trichonephila clavipes]|nr:hypothetical protein TNCV_430651 [Trichonephila clavipes]